VNVSRATVNVSRATVNVSRATVNVSRATVNVSRATVNAFNKNSFAMKRGLEQSEAMFTYRRFLGMGSNSSSFTVPTYFQSFSPACLTISMTLFSLL
jgi:hypothetical protein